MAVQSISLLSEPFDGWFAARGWAPRQHQLELLAKARVVQAGEPEFAALDAKYLKGCRNPLVKSAIPKN